MSSSHCIEQSKDCSYGLSVNEESRRADALERSAALLQDSYDVNFDRLARMASRALMVSFLIFSFFLIMI